MAEIDFWRERNATLSALSEQMKLPTVKKVLDVCSIVNPGLVHNLDLAELMKYHVEAADNVRFLTTLERHLKASTFLLSNFSSKLPIICKPHTNLLMFCNFYLRT